MDTLQYQKQRLEDEIISAKECIIKIRESEYPDLKSIHHHSETIERNMQLIGMIDFHVTSDHQPMWRRK